VRVERDLVGARQVGRQVVRGEGQRDRAGEHADQQAEHGHHQAGAQRVALQVAAARAERVAHAVFVGPRQHARELQAGDVAGRDQQQQQATDQHQQQVAARARCDQPGAGVDRQRAPAVVAARMRGGQPRGDRRELADTKPRSCGETPTTRSARPSTAISRPTMPGSAP